MRQQCTNTYPSKNLPTKKTGPARSHVISPTKVQMSPSHVDARPTQDHCSANHSCVSDISQLIPPCTCLQHRFFISQQYFNYMRTSACHVIPCMLQMSTPIHYITRVCTIHHIEVTCFKHTRYVTFSTTWLDKDLQHPLYLFPSPSHPRMHVCTHTCTPCDSLPQNAPADSHTNKPLSPWPRPLAHTAEANSVDLLLQS